MDTKKSTKSHPTRRFILLGVLAALVIGWVAFGLTDQGKRWYQSLADKAGLSIDFGAKKGNELSKVDNKDNQAAEQAIASGRTDDAIKAYESKINGTSSKNRKAVLYRELSNLLLMASSPSEQQLQQGVSYALKAYELDQSGESAAQVAVAYRKVGNQAEADTYQRIASEKAKALLND